MESAVANNRDISEEKQIWLRLSIAILRLADPSKMRSPDSKTTATTNSPRLSRAICDRYAWNSIQDPIFILLVGGGVVQGDFLVLAEDDRVSADAIVLRELKSLNR